MVVNAGLHRASASAPRLSFSTLEWEKSQIVSVCLMLSVLVVETNMEQTLWRVPRKQKCFQLGPCEGAVTSVVSANKGRMLASRLFIHSLRLVDG